MQVATFGVECEVTNLGIGTGRVIVDDEGRIVCAHVMANALGGEKTAVIAMFEGFNGGTLGKQALSGLEEFCHLVYYIVHVRDVVPIIVGGIWRLITFPVWGPEKIITPAKQSGSRSATVRGNTSDLIGRQHVIGIRTDTGQPQVGFQDRGITLCFIFTVVHQGDRGGGFPASPDGPWPRMAPGSHGRLPLPSQTY
ncbi:hypothetical protein ES703_123029 [subsurface metagenome]